MQRKMRLITASIALLLALIVFNLPGAFAQSETQSALRFVHVIPGVQDIDVYINDSLSVSGLSFGEATTYITVPTGTVNLRVTLAGLTTALWEQPVPVPPGDNYTLIASSTDPLNFASFRDDPTSLGLGTARIMVVHALSGGPAVDFRVNGDLVVGDLQYGGFVNSIDVPANTYEMSFVPTGGSEADAVLPATPIALTSLTTQIVVLYGTASSAQTLVLTTPTVPAGDAGFVRFTHGAADAAEVNILLNGTLVVPSLAYGKSTEHLAIPAGDHTVSIQDAAAGNELASAKLTVVAGEAQTLVALAGLGGISTGIFPDSIGDSSSRQALVSVINTSPDAAANVTLAGTDLATDLAAGAASEVVTIDPVDAEVEVELGTADGAVNQTSESTVFYGGVYYNVFVLQDGLVVVAPTSLTQTIDSAPGASEAVEVVAATAVPTEVVEVQPTTADTTDTTAPTATTEAVVVQPTAVPTNTGPTARILLDPGVNLQLRQYPSAEALSLGLAPSGTILQVNGREGAPADRDGNEIPLADGTDFVDPVTLLEDDTVDLDADGTWLNITYNTPDGGTITAWVNALYVDVDDARGLAQRLRDLPTVPRNRPGEANSTSITSPVPTEAFVEAIVTQLDAGVNLNIRRTAQTDSEVLARVASGIPLELIGFGESGDWAFVRYLPASGGSVTGWANTLYLRYEFRDAPIDLVEMEQRGLLEEVDEATLRGEVSNDVSVVSQPTQNPLRNVYVATVVQLNEGIRLNVRRNPSVNAEVLANIPPGVQVVVLSRDLSGEWLQTEFEGITGWISTQYVTLSFNGLSVDLEEIPLNDDLVAGATITATITVTEAPPATATEAPTTTP